MSVNWLKIGWELARLIFYTSFSLVLGALVYRNYVGPEITNALEEASKTITNLAKLGGVKSQEYAASKTIERAVAEDFIKNQIPELELVKTFVSPKTWEEIENTIENNPEAIIQLWEKYGHYFTNQEQQQQQSDYMF